MSTKRGNRFGIERGKQISQTGKGEIDRFGMERGKQISQTGKGEINKSLNRNTGAQRGEKEKGKIDKIERGR